VKFLLDENLSPKLVRHIAEMFPGSQHVRLIGLASASDQEVWEYATRGGYVIISKDSDFHQRSLLYGFPPKVVWFRRGNCSTRDILSIFQDHLDNIVQFLNDGSRLSPFSLSNRISYGPCGVGPKTAWARPR
jgi:predicted nuclease of predicted toxin-antitoxin system